VRRQLELKELRQKFKLPQLARQLRDYVVLSSSRGSMSPTQTKTDQEYSRWLESQAKKEGIVA